MARDTRDDFRHTVFLPTTSFAMRGDLPKREPLILKRWQDMNLYEAQRQKSHGRPLFVVADGPPYANGHLHMGHALNKILKDVVTKARFMMGFDAVFVPGWDCHGLPIEWKIEEQYRDQKRSKDSVPVNEFRHQCRLFAEKWIAIQTDEFQRLGITGDWKNPYTTMDFYSESKTIAALGRLAIDGYIVRKAKPVLWSVVEQTALAEAEVDYLDRTSSAIFVDFKVNPEASTNSLLSTLLSPDESLFTTIWTTTPWTLPGNRAIAYGPDLKYVIARITGADGKTRCRIIAEALLATIVAATGSVNCDVIARVSGHELAGIVCRHPWFEHGYGFHVPLLPGEHVTDDSGTGLVHTAPSHGIEDFQVGQAHDLEVPETVSGDGLYTTSVPMFAGQHIFKVDAAIQNALKNAGALWHAATLTHSYPHSWRSKAPLIYRATPQWFVSMDHQNLRQKALACIQQTHWVPATGENRLSAMVAQRPDWCISRQRAWGVPIALFTHRGTGEVLRDERVFRRIADKVAQEGCDVWFSGDRNQFLAPDYNPEDFDACTDILDVWFDAGCTQEFVLRARKGLQAPADLYLEGSDQHRGWFQSSLLIGTALHGVAPFKTVLTHGFVVDDQGRKMSKSLGNTVDLDKLLATYGADIVRLWTVSVDYTQDLKIGQDLLKQLEDIYRRFRNTLRYLLGALAGHDDALDIPYDELPMLEQWILHRLAEINEVVEKANARFDYHDMIQQLHHFCASDLSAFYFDVRKDSLYCDSPTSLVRRATLTVFEQVFDCLIRWLAPILAFTTEEAWLARQSVDATQSDALDRNSIHLQAYPVVPVTWLRNDLHVRMESARTLRRVITGAVEKERAACKLGSSLQAHAMLYYTSDLAPSLREVLLDIDWDEFSLVSQISFHEQTPPETAFSSQDVKAFGVVVLAADGEKCPRCWKVLPTTHPDHLCERCSVVVQTTSSGTSTHE